MVLQNSERRIERLEYNGQPVVTFEQVDELHGYYLGTSRTTFYRYRDKLVPGKDYLSLPFEVWSKIKADAIRSILESGYNSDKIFLTCSGYLMLIKRFKDDLAWRVQQMLINGNNVFDRLLYHPDRPAAQPHTFISKGKVDYKNVLDKTLEEISLISGLLNMLVEKNKPTIGKA